MSSWIKNPSSQRTRDRTQIIGVFSKLKYWLWDAEVPTVNERWRWLFNVYAVGFAVIYAVSFLPMMIHAAFLGPGLGEPKNLDYLWALLHRLRELGESSGHYEFLIAVSGLLAFGVAFRTIVIIRAYFKYRGTNQERFPQQHLIVFGLVNLISIVAIFAVLGLAGLVFLMLGGTVTDGFGLIEDMSFWAHETVMREVPTLVALPSWLAVFIVYMFAGFLHYWLHRFGHTFRAGWLLFHRPHHMPSVLSQHTTTAVFYAIPLFLFAVIPYNFIFAAATKLFSTEPQYSETILINLFVVISETYGHSTALYHEGRKNPVIRWLGWIFLNGPYHYLHHSSERADAGSAGRVNMVNIAGGLFGFWDRVFGTYRPLREDKPPIGLTGNPPLHMNPMRLALSGMWQIGYELRHNRGLKTWLLILLGPSSYDPPITKDYAVKV